MDQLNLDLTALQTALTAVVADVAALPTSTPVTSTDPNDAVVSDFVNSLTAAGWTVTAPATPEAPVEPEIPAVA
jgi:hypothetical protein